MTPQEPTRHQLSSRLSYSQHTPPFLQKLKNRIAGVQDEEEEYEYDESGRPPIPKRPAIPTRPDDDPGSADEEDNDEKPQVVVLKEGKHLTEREAENVRRKEKGLKPLDEANLGQSLSNDANEPTSNTESAPKAKLQTPALSFSSSKSGLKPSKGKRKAVGDLDDGIGTKSRMVTGKKGKKSSKALLSFGDDA